MDKPTTLKEIWDVLIEKVEAEIGFAETELWIKPVKPLVLENGVLKIEVPNSVIYETIKTKYHSRLLAILRSAAGNEAQIKYSLNLDIPKKESDVSSIMPPPPKKQNIFHNFNPNYTFKTFIVGNSNRWAYSSAKAVAETPGTLNNPFFIYSQPGLGKTHLMHAIANEILGNNPHLKISYIPSESFVNEFITAIQKKDNHPDQFRQKYRNIDCLLLDDIQFLTGKDRSEEEFFYTFNTLSDSKKQIVITSDRPPRELALGQRLISRFFSGVVADIRFPELETRIAILRQKNDNFGFNLPEDIITFIAENIKESIRELEGALLTVGNYCLNMNIQPSIDKVVEIMKDHKFITSQDQEVVSIEKIQSVIANEYNLNTRDFKSSKRAETIAYPRQIAMYLATNLTDMSLEGIGKSFNKDHSTVVYAKKKIEQKIHEDAFFSAFINKLITKVKERGT